MAVSIGPWPDTVPGTSLATLTQPVDPRPEDCLDLPERASACHPDSSRTPPRLVSCERVGFAFYVFSGSRPDLDRQFLSPVHRPPREAPRPPRSPVISHVRPDPVRPCPGCGACTRYAAPGCRDPGAIGPRPPRSTRPRSTLPRLRYGGRHIGLAPAARPRHGRPVGPRPVRPRPGCGACRLFLAAATFDPVPPRPVRSGSAASGLWDVRVVECTAGLRGGGRFPSARRRPPEPLVGPASTFHPPPLCRPLAPVTFLPLGPRPRPPPSESPDWSVPATRPVRHLPDGAVRFVRTPRRPLLQKNPDFARPISAHPDIGANRDDSRETRTLRFRPEPCVERRF